MRTRDPEPIARALLMASAMLAIALLGAAFFVSQSVDRGAHALRRMTLTLADAPALSATRTSGTR